MKRVALLVDWENVQKRLGDLYYPTDPSILAPGLRGAAENVAKQEVGGYVCFRKVFAPASAFQGRSLEHFRSFLEIESTRGGKNAADLAIVVAALRLHFKNEADIFILVTGDIDYLVLAEALARDGRVCHIWAIDDRRTNVDLRNWSPFQWVPELLGLKVQEKPTTRDNDIFLFVCQRLLDDGGFLGSPTYTVPKLQEYRLLADEKVAQLYDLWLTNGRRKKDALSLDRAGTEQSRGGRLTYELKEEVRRPLWLGTLCLDAVANKLSKEREAASRGDLLKVLEYPGMGSEERDELFETLERSGYLVEMGGRVTGRSSVRRDLLGGPLRVATQVWYALVERKWDVVGSGYLRQRWERVVKPGRELNAVEKSEADDEASAAARAAAAAGVIAYGMADEHRRGYRLNTKHPLVQYSQEAVRTVVVRLRMAGAGKAKPLRHADFVVELSASPVNWTKAEIDFWLGICAAERIVTWRQGQVWLNTGRFVDVICDDRQ